MSHEPSRSHKPSSNSNEIFSASGGWLGSPHVAAPGTRAIYGDTSSVAATRSIGSTLITAATASATNTSTSSPFKINITWDASVAKAPAGFEAAVIAAAQTYEAAFDNNVTINIDVGYGEVAGSTLGASALGESESSLISVSYATLQSALKSEAAVNPAIAAALQGSLPTTAPAGGTVWLTSAQAKALGVTPATSSTPDGYVGFSAILPFTYSNANGVAAATYDFTDTVEHELSEVMGRIMLTGQAVGAAAKSYSLLDMLHFSSAGTHDYLATTAGYFSINNGATNLGQFNTVAGGDAGDWSSTVTINAYDAFSYPATVNGVSANDLTEMEALGWTPAGAVAVTPPTGVTFTASTAALASGETATGLAGGKALFGAAQTGGVAGDVFNYTLGGAAAANFTVSAGGVVSTGKALVGAAGGTLYAVTVTANDGTGFVSSVAKPVDVVVGGGGGVVSLASLVGSANAGTPCFIYPSGSESVTGVGLTGRLDFAALKGDVLTGGAGVNDYLFGAVGDTGVTIANFSTAHDLIDLTGLGAAKLSYAGALTGASIAADTIGCTTSGGNSFVYVNTAGSSAALTSGSLLKIQLNGVIGLGAGNFIHN